MKVAVSILSINDNYLEKIVALNETDCDYIHLDVMDGKFVNHVTMNDNMLIEYAKHVTKPIDIHFMVSDVKSYIDKYLVLQPKYITFHYEAVLHPQKIIQKIKSTGINVGISIKPNTPVSVLLPYLKYLDLILVMSVEPGMGGQTFITNTASKIQELQHLKEQYGYRYQIEVDGGINANTIKQVQGADIVVSGSFVTNSMNYQEQINLLRK